jgi:hypothetical protein
MAGCRAHAAADDSATTCNGPRWRANDTCDDVRVIRFGRIRRYFGKRAVVVLAEIRGS